MATTVQYLKIGRLEAVVKITGTGTATIPLASLKKLDETLGTTPVANIHSLQWCTNTTGLITVSRGGALMYNLQLASSFVLDASNDNQNNTSDIAVDLGTQPATLIINLRKMAGYKEPDQQSAP